MMTKMADHRRRDAIRATSTLAEAVLAAVAPRIRAAERERCAAMAGNVSVALSAGVPMCPCGNGRTPVTAYRYACEAFAAAIRRKNGDE